MNNSAISPENTAIAVIGGGNIGTQFACVCAAKGYHVRVCSSHPERYSGALEAVDEFGRVVSGRPHLVTSDIGAAVEGCGVIFVTHPAFRLQEVARALLPHVAKGMKIGVIPGTGGAEFAFRDCMVAGATLFGLQRVPSVARLEQYGRRVRCEGKRAMLHLAAIPGAEAPKIAEFMADLFDISCSVLPNYLCVTLTPSNPILHTTRLRTLFADYSEGKVYPRNPLFYGEWDIASSELLLDCDDELQRVCKSIDGLDLSPVRSLRLHYESDTPEAMTRKLRSIRSLHDLPSPMKQTGAGWVPDFQSRYFTADFPFGLAILNEIAGLLEVDVPHIRETLEWYRRTTGDESGLQLKACGIHTPRKLCAYYER